MNVFNKLSYKEILISGVEAKKKTFATRYTFQGMADHCRIQKTYLSKVLNREGNLSADQLFLACNYLGFNREEREYILLLLDLDNAQLPERRKELNETLQRIRKTKTKTEANINAQIVISEQNQLANYYLDPYFSLIHMFLTISFYAKNPNRIGQELRLPQEKLHFYLTELERMGVVRFSNTHYQILQNNLHLPENSPMQKAFRTMMRLKSLEQIEKVLPEETYNFSVSFSASAKTKALIQEKFLAYLNEVQKLVQNSPEEHVYQMNYDLFLWG